MLRVFGVADMSLGVQLTIQLVRDRHGRDLGCFDADPSPANWTSHLYCYCLFQMQSGSLFTVCRLQKPVTLGSCVPLRGSKRY